MIFLAACKALKRIIRDTKFQWEFTEREPCRAGAFGGAESAPTHTQAGGRWLPSGGPTAPALGVQTGQWSGEQPESGKSRLTTRLGPLFS